VINQNNLELKHFGLLKDIFKNLLINSNILNIQFPLKLPLKSSLGQVQIKIFVNFFGMNNHKTNIIFRTY